jgi:hypothetical protein
MGESVTLGKAWPSATQAPEVADVIVRITVAAALLALATGCESAPDSSDETAPSTGSATLRAAQPTERSVSVRPPRVQHLPPNWSTRPWGGSGRPEQAPTEGAALPSVLGQPGSPAGLAYHPLERLNDPAGWASERVLFLGLDGQWRGLDLAELGLPEAWWTGEDTFGPGSLSADGRIWAAHTNAGVVFVNLTTGSYRHVALPPTSPRVRYLTWVPGANAVSAYATNSKGARYWTFHVRPGGSVSQVSYPGDRTRFDIDGTPVEVKTAGRTLTMTRFETRGTDSAQSRLPLRFHRSTIFSEFGQDDVALIQPTYSIRRPVMVWVFDKHTGQPRARLQVPVATSIEGWTHGGSLVLMVDNRRLITWNPQAGRFRRLLEIPPPYPDRNEWAATTVSLPSP